MPAGETPSRRFRFVVIIVFGGAHHLFGHRSGRRDDLHIHAEDQQQTGNQDSPAPLPFGQPHRPDAERGQDRDNDEAGEDRVQGGWGSSFSQIDMVRSAGARQIQGFYGHLPLEMMDRRNDG